MLELRYRRTWVALVWMLAALIVVASLVPNGILPDAHGIDKLEHFAAYFTLTTLCAGIVARASIPWVIVGVILLGLSMEAAQALFTETRTADWADALANTTGVLIAWLLVRRRVGWAMAAEAWLARRRGH